MRWICLSSLVICLASGGAARAAETLPEPGFLHLDGELAAYADRIIDAWRRSGSRAARDVAATDRHQAQELADELERRLISLRAYLLERLIDRCKDELPNRQVRRLGRDLGALRDLARRERVTWTGDMRFAQHKLDVYASLARQLGEQPEVRWPHARAFAWVTIAPDFVLAAQADDQAWFVTTLGANGEVRPGGAVGRLFNVAWEVRGGPSWTGLRRDPDPWFLHARVMFGVGPSRLRHRHHDTVGVAFRRERGGTRKLTLRAPRYGQQAARWLGPMAGAQLTIWPGLRTGAAGVVGFRFSNASSFRWGKGKLDRALRFRAWNLVLDGHLLFGADPESSFAAGAGFFAQLSAGAYAVRLWGSVLGSEAYGQAGISMVGFNFASPRLRRAVALHEAGDFDGVEQIERHWKQDR